MKSMVPSLMSFTISAGSRSLMDFMKEDSQQPPSEARSAARLLKRSATGLEETIFFMQCLNSLNSSWQRQMAQFSERNSTMSGMRPLSFLRQTRLRYWQESPTKLTREETTTFSEPRQLTYSMMPLGSMLNLMQCPLNSLMFLLSSSSLRTPRSSTALGSELSVRFTQQYTMSPNRALPTPTAMCSRGSSSSVYFSVVRQPSPSTSSTCFPRMEPSSRPLYRSSLRLRPTERFLYLWLNSQMRPQAKISFSVVWKLDFTMRRPLQTRPFSWIMLKISRSMSISPEVMKKAQGVASSFHCCCCSSSISFSGEIFSSSSSLSSSISSVILFPISCSLMAISALFFLMSSSSSSQLSAFFLKRTVSQGLPLISQNSNPRETLTPMVRRWSMTIFSTLMSSKVSGSLISCASQSIRSWLLSKDCVLRRLEPGQTQWMRWGATPRAMRPLMKAMVWGVRPQMVMFCGFLTLRRSWRFSEPGAKLWQRQGSSMEQMPLTQFLSLQQGEWASPQEMSPSFCSSVSISPTDSTRMSKGMYAFLSMSIRFSFLSSLTILASRTVVLASTIRLRSSSREQLVLAARRQSRWDFTCMVTRPPGASSVMFVKFTSRIISSDSMKERPVSEAPTTTMRVLFSAFVESSCFLVTIESEKGASSSSQGSRFMSTAPRLERWRLWSSGENWKFHFFLRKWGKTRMRRGVNQLKISGRRVRLCTSKQRQVLAASLMISRRMNLTLLMKRGLTKEQTTLAWRSRGCSSRITWSCTKKCETQQSRFTRFDTTQIPITSPPHFTVKLRCLDDGLSTASRRSDQIWARFTASESSGCARGMSARMVRLTAISLQKSESL